MEDRDGNPTEFLWELSDGWSSETKWTQGRVEIKPQIVANDYRVNSILFRFIIV